MNLEFPHARLRVFTYLASDSDSCFEAVAKSAVDLGLVDETFLADKPSSLVGCGSLVAARKILEDCASHHAELSRNKELIWKQIVSDLAEYRDGLPSKTGEPERGPMHCAMRAPVIMDLLLQHLRAYI